MDPDLFRFILEMIVAPDTRFDPTHAAPYGALHERSGGAYRDRTDDPLLAKQVLSQLS